MVSQFRELRDMTDDALIDAHEKMVEHGAMPDYYLHEIERRERVESDKKVYNLTIATVILASVSVIIALVALFVR